MPSSKFRYCNYLIELVFAETSSGLTEIGAWAFEDCHHLQRMTAFSVGLLRVRPSAYSGCRSLSGALVFPGTVVLVDEYCFHHCSAVTHVVFRDPRTPAATPVELGRFVFKMCSALQSAQLPQNLVVIPHSTFFGCTALLQCPIPVSVDEIELLAFFRCCALKSLDLPARTSRIGYRAYGECTSLATVTIRATKVLDCGYKAFDRCTSLMTITIRASEVRYGQKVLAKCPALATIQVYPSVWTNLFESMNEDPTFLFKFVRNYQSCKWTA